MKYSRATIALVVGAGILLSAGRGATVITDLSKLDKPPERDTNEPAVFPECMPASETQADVTMTITVGTDGAVAAVSHVVAPAPAYAGAATAAVKKWRFQPGYSAGNPVEFLMPVTVALRRGALTYRDVSEIAVEAIPLKPAYPKDLMARPVAGFAVLNVLVGTDGNASDPVVEYASRPEFAEPARAVVTGWVFYPAKTADTPVASRVTVRVAFDPGDRDKTEDDRFLESRIDQARTYDVAPKPMSTEPPLVYPYDALMAGKTGTAEVGLIVDLHGAVVQAEATSATDAEFAEAARVAMSAWRFTPATKAGREVFGVMRLVIQFNERAAEFQFDDATLALIAELRAGNSAIVPVKELERHPRPLAQPEIVLPPEMQDQPETWEAAIDCVIDRTGRCVLPKVERATSPAVGWAAAEAVVRLRFEPAEKGGEPVATRVRIPFRSKPKPAPAAGSAGTEPVK